MPWQDIQQVCLNGHQITDRYKDSPIERKQFCTKCGAKTIIECPNCGNGIPGEVHYENVTVFGGYRTSVPNICQYCGNKMPWSESKSSQLNEKNTHTEAKSNVSEKWKLIWGIVIGLSVILGILTDGFQVWDKFLGTKREIPKPILNIGISPIRIYYPDFYSASDTIQVSGKIETGLGVYKFLDSVKVDSLILADSSYFFLDVANPEFELDKVIFQRMIIGETVKEQNITLSLISDITLKGDKQMELYNAKKDILIAIIKLKFPYYFNDTRNEYNVELPVYLFSN